MERKLRVLIAEDNPADAELLELLLIENGYYVSMKRVQTASEMHAALMSAEWDLILSDFSMPCFSGLAALDLLKLSGKDIPFILISGSAGEETAVQAMRAGAHDFFTKGSLALLIPAIQRELREAELRATARAQREQLQQNEKLAALGTLLAGIAHELNNPLSIILHQATMLQIELKDDTSGERVDSIFRAVTTCSRIVRNFLALARQEPPRRIAVSLNDIVREVLELVGFGLRMDAIKVDLDLAEALPPVAGDPQQLERVLLNLVTNAQYALRSRPHSRRLTIRSRVDSSLQQVTFSITDNGEGIPPEIRSRIFDPFFTTKPAGQGTGLGLSLCHGIITAHEGTISVSSESGAGTSFLISLPVVGATSSHVEEENAQEPENPALHILVVDDNHDVALALSEILSIQGHVVGIAHSGCAALQQIATGTYDLVVSDMRMPDFDGPMLYREATARWPHLKRSFLFATGDVFSPETDRFLKETGAAYVRKPCTFDEMASAIREVLRESETSSTVDQRADGYRV